MNTTQFTIITCVLLGIYTMLTLTTHSLYLELKQLNSATEDIRQLLLTNTN